MDFQFNRVYVRTISYFKVLYPVPLLRREQDLQEPSYILAGYWNIDRRIYYYAHVVNIYLPAKRVVFMSLVSFLPEDILVWKLGKFREGF